tara:strand:- start:229399 stop:231114 length:1716 start_codon:yes stop_codon:yes gene_type:complete
MSAGFAHAQSPIERLVSPGKLSSAHEEQEKVCASCHASFNKKGQAALCLDCHKDINADLAGRQGFHGKSPDVAGADCKTCHTEHIGRDADIRGLDTKSFDHSFTDYPLLGKHATAECKACHQPGIAFSKAPQTCSACHGEDDPHKGKLGSTCADCHSEATWQAIEFDHFGTDFPLLGKHGAVACLSCHKNQVWGGLSAKCIDCHKADDPHEGRFGPDCASCHSADSWTQTRFNHDQTGFSLIGKHASAECAECHGPGKPDPAPTTCVACHRSDDVHKGTNGAACADCHTPKNWKTVSFDHSKTGFALLGAHKTTLCASCHTRPTSEWKPPSTCIGCHTADDRHDGLLGPLCATCHEETSWTKVRFDHDRDTDFAIAGAHKAATCASCHKVPVNQKAPPVSCVGCHRTDDPHKGQLGDGCAQCHNEQSWTENVKFNHEFTDFPLLGAHAAATCGDCHATKAYLDASKECASCHQDKDVHKGGLGAECGQCHNPVSWSRWSFDHTRQTSFPLTGKHSGLDCAQCHKSQSGQDMKISTRCVSCHAADDKHRGAFGTTCDRCHTTEAFWAVEMNR